MAKISWIIVATGPEALAGSNLKRLKIKGITKPVKIAEIMAKKSAKASTKLIWFSS